MLKMSRCDSFGVIRTVYSISLRAFSQMTYLFTVSSISLEFYGGIALGRTYEDVDKSNFRTSSTATVCLVEVGSRPPKTCRRVV